MIFPANNIWNTPVDTLPVHQQSAAWLALVGTAAPLRLDDVMPVNEVSSATPMFNLPPTDQSDGGGYPIPPLANIELGSDLHCLIIQDTMLYEIFNLRGGPAWVCDSAAKWDLGSNALRTYGWTSADAAGLPITPGLLRYDEVVSGGVTHALRFTAPHTFGGGTGTPDDPSWAWPARHKASHNPDGPPMGARVRLKAGFDVSKFTPRQQSILNGLKKYGALLSDNGMPWGMQRVTDPRWDAAEIAALHAVLGASMEFVDASGLMSDPDSGAAGTPLPGVFATDLLGRRNAVGLDGLKIVGGKLTVVGTIPTPQPPIVPLSGLFVRLDTVTSGSWQGVYGADGYDVIQGDWRDTPFAKVSPVNNQSYIWGLTKDPRALQTGTNRTAACWYSPTSFSLDVNLTDGKPHQVAIYCIDWDGNGGGRSQKVEVLDAGGNVLDSRLLSGFGGGVYLVWNLSGHAVIRITNLNPASNALLSGIFFDSVR